ncbi:hypothetical protein HPG69_007821 [Diceros bicornis minor]|uniref:Uncharacterized protein n=1 Tax=Diceros bicornis minor TaxID=77932 RepID=A0A7J7EAR6_DICBM|nr:hypothetical protein HPG69_007821 [Diceros bicornis minor]
MQGGNHNTKTVPWVYLQCKKNLASLKCGHLFNQVYVTEGGDVYALARKREDFRFPQRLMENSQRLTKDPATVSVSSTSRFPTLQHRGRCAVWYDTQMEKFFTGPHQQVDSWRCIRGRRGERRDLPPEQ